MIKILDSGFYTTIQDTGRFGYREFGVPVSGVMDKYSSRFANMLLGNNSNAAIIEATMTGPKLIFLKATKIAISGADMQPQINALPVLINQVLKIEKNDVLSFGKLLSGFRTYIAVWGGFKSKLCLGSQSMYKNITDAAQLKSNDYVDFEDFKPKFIRKYAVVKYNASVINSGELHVFKGPEFNSLSEDNQKKVLEATYNISNFHNRMAYQLLPKIEHHLSSILTAPVLPGTVQLTPSGQLIVLMRDCQTTGGYPRVLQLSESAINTLSQKNTNNKIRFKL